MKKNLLAALLFCGFQAVFAQFQPNPIEPTAATERLHAFEQRTALTTTSLAKNLPVRAVGPTIFSCRVADIDVNPTDPTHFLVAYASGGLWKTESNGSDFTPLFDHEAVMTIGDIACDWKRNIIWVGTGENISSRSSYAGVGMFRSADGGKTWENRGLNDSHHIGRVVLHPENPDVLWVGALGHLYSPNAERGVFKTTDGGKTWKNTLFVNENTGCIDLVIDPMNPQILYAAMWERARRAWNFDGCGAGSGIYKSSDGGETWQLVSGPKSGFPSNNLVGRIGLDFYQKDGKSLVFACVDNQNERPKKVEEKLEKDVLTKDSFRNMPIENFNRLTDERLENYLTNNDFPEKYTVKKVRELVKTGKIQPRALVDFFEQDANPDLSKSNFIGAEIYRSDDGGSSWKKCNKDYLDDLYYTYGYVFAQVRVSPHDPEKVYLMGVPIVKSTDGGQTFKSINGDNVHADHHCLWENPQRAGHLINGNDGGLNMSYDDGKTWFKLNNPPVGQFYAINVDAAEPYNVYGGAQDNGVWWGSSKAELNTEWTADGQNPYKSILGGDGMQVMIDPRDNKTVYTGSQFGFDYRVNKETGDSKFITPQHELGERPLRWNWQSPIWLSKHQPDVLYFGANKLFRSLNRGDDWEAISGDLTGGSRKGNVPFGTIVSLHESPLKFGKLIVGTDDGFIWLSKNGGDDWKKISDGLPQNRWVSRVQFSNFEKNRLFVSLNGYRWDDFSSYLFYSENDGETWTRLGENLPTEAINVVREDPTNPDLIYVGTDHAVYFSLNRGKTFERLSKNLPDAPVHDLVVQPKANELVIGTHGRSMWIASVAHLQAMNSENLAQDLLVFDPPKKRWSGGWGKNWNKYLPVKEPELPIDFYSKTGGSISWTVKTKDGLVLREGKIEAEPGLQTLVYNLDFNEKQQKAYEKELNAAAAKDKKAAKPIELKKADTGHFYLYKGAYSIEFELNGKRVSKDFSLDGPRRDDGEPENGGRPSEEFFERMK